MTRKHAIGDNGKFKKQDQCLKPVENSNSGNSTAINIDNATCANNTTATPNENIENLVVNSNDILVSKSTAKRRRITKNN